MYILVTFGGSIKHGAGITQQIYFDKACLYTLGYNESICESLDEHQAESEAVQRVVNDFNLYSSFIRNALVVVGSLFAGHFADRFGMRLSLALAMIGE